MHTASDPDQIIKTLYNHAKNQWAWALSLKASAGSIGILSAFVTIAPTLSVVVVFVLVILSEGFQFNADRVKSAAEALKRKRDMQDSFGWSITEDEWAKVLLEYQSLLKTFKLDDTSNMYFASQREVSPERAIENLHESTFFSRTIFNRMWRICLWIMLFFGFLTIVAFAIAVYVITQMDVHTAKDAIALASRVIVGVFMIFLGLGLMKIALAYSGFAQKSDSLFDKAGELRKSGNVDQTQAVKMWNEYQLARASSPLVPEWLFLKWNGTLNAIYESTFVETQHDSAK